MPRGRPRKRLGGPGSVAAAGMSGAVTSLRALRDELLGQRAALDVQINAIDNALRSIGAAPSRGPGRALFPRRVGRPPGKSGKGPRPGSLKAYIAQVLSRGGVMAVKDITAAVLQAGYKTANKTLAKSVGIALTEMKNVRKVARGRFRLK